MMKKVKVGIILALLISVISFSIVVFGEEKNINNMFLQGSSKLEPFVEFEEKEYKIFSKIKNNGKEMVLCDKNSTNNNGYVVMKENKNEDNNQVWILKHPYVTSKGTLYYAIQNKGTGRYICIDFFAEYSNYKLFTRDKPKVWDWEEDYYFGFGSGNHEFDLSKDYPEYYYIWSGAFFGHALKVKNDAKEITATKTNENIDLNEMEKYIFTLKEFKNYKHSIKGQVYQLPLSYDNKEYNLISEASIYEKNLIKDMVKNDGKDFEKLLNENKIIDDCKVEIVNKVDDDKLKLNRDGTFEILTNKDEIELNLKRDGYEDVGATINIKDCEKSELLAFMKEFKEVKTVLKGKVLEVTGNDKVGVFYTEQSSTKGISAKIKLIDSEGTSKEVRSNSNGIFNFEDMALGEYKLGISASEYDTKKINGSKIVLKEEENNIYIYLDREIKDDGKNPEAEIMFEYNSEDEGAFTSAKSTLTNYSEPVYVLKGWIEYNDGTKEKWDVDKDKKNLIVKFDDKSVKKSNINKNAVIYYEIVDMKGNKSTISETLVLKQDR